MVINSEQKELDIPVRIRRWFAPTLQKTRGPARVSGHFMRSRGRGERGWRGRRNGWRHDPVDGVVGEPWGGLPVWDWAWAVGWGDGHAWHLVESRRRLTIRDHARSLRTSNGRPDGHLVEARRRLPVGNRTGALRSRDGIADGHVLWLRGVGRGGRRIRLPRVSTGIVMIRLVVVRRDGAWRHPTGRAHPICALVVIGTRFRVVTGRRAGPDGRWESHVVVRMGARVRWHATRFVVGRVERLHLHGIGMGFLVLHPTGYGAVPAGHGWQCILVDLRGGTLGGIEARHLLLATINRRRGRRLIDGIRGRGHRRRGVIIRVIQVLGTLVPRRRAAARATTTASTALDAAAHAVDNTSDNGEDNDGSHDDRHDDRPFAVGFGHTVVPTGQGLGCGFEVAHKVPDP